MSNQTKILIIFTAIVAFVIGFALNTLRVETVANVDTLLNAKLLDDNNQSNEVRQQLGKKLTLINFWATWCSPCRREMPMFEAIYQKEQNNGFTIVGIAIDNAEQARPMLDSMGITYPILYAEQTGMELMASAGNQQGGLPYSLLLDEYGNVIDQKLGEIHEAQILSWSAGKAYTEDSQ